ncbi:hypothetical protein LPB90_12420 [Chryseobacterium sp. LC2016-29]|uniref:hypothetical protein n=1 Tax=Chryseobacterium sp. LC2016-29 TaxID=2897331 RepID=UPI001E62ACDB|nr:hypothetical protein [Chryseobacterium sp. LC2016-29]MCD0479263.1 hypothetical protein [Chryseobacterium sp. LC2016-29]
MKHYKKYISLTSLLLICSCSSPSKNNQKSNDDFYEKSRKLVLSENKINQEYHFSIIGKGIDEIDIKYLGNIITSQKDTLKIINSQNVSGYLEESKRGNGSVYIYNSKNELIGFYFVGDYWAVPSKIENQSLVFKFNNHFCNETTKISLKDSIPKKIFIQCTKEGGDIYNLETAYE